MKIILKTYDYENDFSQDVIEITLKQIDELDGNYIKIHFSYEQWIKDGKFVVKDYFLQPESLKKLIIALENSEYEYKFNLIKCKHFLSIHPTFECLLQKIEYYKTLPLDKPIAL